jgi:hypothetical protein
VDIADSPGWHSTQVRSWAVRKRTASGAGAEAAGGTAGDDAGGEGTTGAGGGGATGLGVAGVG